MNAEDRIFLQKLEETKIFLNNNNILHINKRKVIVYLPFIKNLTPMIINSLKK